MLRDPALHELFVRLYSAVGEVPWYKKTAITYVLTDLLYIMNIPDVSGDKTYNVLVINNFLY